MVHAQFADKRMLIFGATGGIGQALARELANRGAKLFLLGRNPSKLQALAEECQADWHPLDQDSLESPLLQEALSERGPFDVGFHLVGHGLFRSAKKITLSEWRELIESNLTSAFAFYQLFDSLNKNSQWDLLFLGSASLQRPWPKNALYGASKAGLKYFCQALQEEVFEEGGRVIHIEAGSVNTPFFDQAPKHLPADKMIQPEDLARFLAELLAQPGRLLSPSIPLLSRPG